MDSGDEYAMEEDPLGDLEDFGDWQGDNDEEDLDEAMGMMGGGGRVNGDLGDQRGGGQNGQERGGRQGGGGGADRVVEAQRVIMEELQEQVNNLEARNGQLARRNKMLEEENRGLNERVKRLVIQKESYRRKWLDAVEGGGGGGREVVGGSISQLQQSGSGNRGINGLGGGGGAGRERVGPPPSRPVNNGPMPSPSSKPVENGPRAISRSVESGPSSGSRSMVNAPRPSPSSRPMGNGPSPSPRSVGSGPRPSPSSRPVETVPRGVSRPQIVVHRYPPRQEADDDEDTRIAKPKKDEEDPPSTSNRTSRLKLSPPGHLSAQPPAKRQKVSPLVPAVPPVPVVNANNSSANNASTTTSVSGPAGKFPCKLCPKRFYVMSVLKKHLKMEHGVIDNSLDGVGCGRCGRGFPTRKDFHQHLFDDHGMKNPQFDTKNKAPAESTSQSSAPTNTLVSNLKGGSRIKEGRRRRGKGRARKIGLRPKHHSSLRLAKFFSKPKEKKNPSGDANVSPQPKKRGRPRKIQVTPPTPEETVQREEEDEGQAETEAEVKGELSLSPQTPFKRGRGRPRKIKPETENEEETVETSAETQVPKKSSPSTSKPKEEKYPPRPSSRLSTESPVYEDGQRKSGRRSVVPTRYDPGTGNYEELAQDEDEEEEEDLEKQQQQLEEDGQFFEEEEPEGNLNLDDNSFAQDFMDMEDNEEEGEEEFDEETEKEHELVECRDDNPKARTGFYKCKCGKEFAKKPTAQVHVQRGNNGKIFTCDLCSKSFVAHQVLKVHYGRAHKLPYTFCKYACTTCGLIDFDTPAELRAHQKEHVKKQE